MYIIVVGCTHIGSMLAKELSNLNHHVVVIERDEQKLESLGTGFNGFVISGVEYDHENLIQAGIEKADALIAVTDDDNLNITISLVANRIFKVKKVIAETIDPSRRDQYDLLGIESFSPVKMGINALLSKMDIVPIETLFKVTSGYEVTQVHVQRTLPISVEDVYQKCEALVTVIISKGIGQLAQKDTLIEDKDIVVCTNHIRDRQRLMDTLVQE